MIKVDWAGKHVVKFQYVCDQCYKALNVREGVVVTVMIPDRKCSSSELKHMHAKCVEYYELGKMFSQFLWCGTLPPLPEWATDEPCTAHEPASLITRKTVRKKAKVSR